MTENIDGIYRIQCRHFSRWFCFEAVAKNATKKIILWNLWVFIIFLWKNDKRLDSPLVMNSINLTEHFFFSKNKVAIWSVNT